MSDERAQMEARAVARARVEPLISEIMEIVGPFAPGFIEDRVDDDLVDTSEGPAFINHWALAIETIDSKGHTFTSQISDQESVGASTVGLFARALYQAL